MRAQHVQTPEELDDYSRQYLAWTKQGVKAYDSTRTYTHSLFGGGKGGSKTVTGVRIFQTDISNYRDGIFVVMRRNYTALEMTTKQSFKKFFPKELIKRQTDDVWYCENNNQIWFFAADKTRDKNYERLRGLELTAVFPDEASEFDDEFFEILPSLFRTEAYHIDTGERLKHYAYYTTNPKPGKNYLKRTFIDPRTRKTHLGDHNFIPSLAKDNPLNPPGYWESAFKEMSEPVKRMLRDGDWDVDASEFVIIPASTFVEVTVAGVSDRTPVSGGIDIGLGAPDLSMVYANNAQGQMFEYDSFAEYDTMNQVDRLRKFCDHVKSHNGSVFIDSSGVGKGTADRLSQLYPGMIQHVNFGEGPAEEKRKKTTKTFQNRRAQLYWWAREDVTDRQFRVALDEDLNEELENTWYEEDAVKIKIIPKEEIKAKIGRSPDRADAFVLANAARRRQRRVSKMALPTVQPRKQINNFSGY